MAPSNISRYLTADCFHIISLHKNSPTLPPITVLDSELGLGAITVEPQYMGSMTKYFHLLLSTGGLGTDGLRHM